MTSAKAFIQTKVSNFRNAFTSWAAFKSYIEAPQTELDEHGNVIHREGHRWSNEDLEPTPPEKRTWSWVNYVTFYWGLSFGNWTLGSTMIGIGLNWWEAIIVIFVSQTISSIAMFFNSRCASVYHVGYPVVARSVFGMWGSFYVVGARAMLAIVWYGIQLYSGASFVAVMLRCIFGHLYTDIPNNIPASAGITSAGMLSFFLFWMVHFPLCAFRPYQLRGFFWFKGVVMCISCFGLFIFCMANTKGNVGSVYQSNITSNNRAWFIIQSINAGMGNTATLITNQPDFARWSRTKTGAMWSQLLSNPLAVTLSASLGILSTAAINNSWGLETPLWNPWDLLGAILDRYWDAGSRAAIFLCAFCWMFSILGTNIAANMIPFGSDVTLLFPKYLTIPRGQFIVEFLAFAINPWKILASASKFTTFLAGYGLFMASVVAIMIADYFLLTKGNVFVAWLYDPTSENKHYYYHRGWNVQAYIAYIAGIALPFAGFVGTLGPDVSEAAAHMGQLGWILSFVVSFAVYWGLCLVWPTRNQRLSKEKGLGWEQAAADEPFVLNNAQVVDAQESSDGRLAGSVVSAEKSGVGGMTTSAS
ncbi:allantoin permease [Diplogelasinospora grovesii]|uniref:Allantoin permease n=1 Tax=Diplogelasinospora grovesii TaxID=303347 RepID=A0AAN6S4C5_9PEZI|nr:allantoin permease [Diplogelasinospora grovesii]